MIFCFEMIEILSIKWDASSRWLFDQNFAWSSIETTVIGKTHPTLFCKNQKLTWASCCRWTIESGLRFIIFKISCLEFFFGLGTIGIDFLAENIFRILSARSGRIELFIKPGVKGNSSFSWKYSLLRGTTELVKSVRAVFSNLGLEMKEIPNLW